MFKKHLEAVHNAWT